MVDIDAFSRFEAAGGTYVVVVMIFVSGLCGSLLLVCFLWHHSDSVKNFALSACGAVTCLATVVSAGGRSRVVRKSKCLKSTILNGIVAAERLI